MRDVGAVETFAPGDEQLGGDHLFSGEDLAADAEDFIILGAIDPRLLYGEGGIADAGNEVDEIVASASFGQPDRILHIGVETFLTRTLKARGTASGGSYEIEIFSGAPDAGVMMKGKSSTDGERDIGVKKSAQNSLVAGDMHRGPSPALAEEVTGNSASVSDINSSMQSNSGRALRKIWLRKGGRVDWIDALGARR